MFFQDYKQHKYAQIRRSLFWEYEFDKINWNDMRDVVVQRVIERGRMDDFYAILNLYGFEGVIDAIKNIPYMNSKDQAFVCSVFNIDKKDLKCFSRKQSTGNHWDSYPNNTVKDRVEEQGIRMASPIDIAAMKLNAISGRGTRLKDFVDIAYISSIMSFNTMLEGYEKKYSSNPIIPIKAILYFDDINFNQPISMTGDKAFNWKTINDRLQLMQKNPNKIFNKID